MTGVADMERDMKCEWCDRESTLGLSVRRNGTLRVYGTCGECLNRYYALPDDVARDVMLAHALGQQR